MIIYINILGHANLCLKAHVKQPKIKNIFLRFLHSINYKF